MKGERVTGFGLQDQKTRGESGSNIVLWAKPILEMVFSQKVVYILFVSSNQLFSKVFTYSRHEFIYKQCIL